jgi:hypothetical protein
MNGPSFNQTVRNTHSLHEAETRFIATSQGAFDNTKQVENRGAQCSSGKIPGIIRQAVQLAAEY